MKQSNRCHRRNSKIRYYVTEPTNGSNKDIVLINSAATLVYASSFVNFSCSAEGRLFTYLIHRQHSGAVLPSPAISLSYMFCITGLIKIHKILGYARNEDKNAPNTSQGSVAT